MRKFYSLVLTALFLLVGTSLWAVDYDLSNGAFFDTYWANVAANGGKITLTTDVQISTGKAYWLGTTDMNGTSKTVEIDLNGCTMQINGWFLLTHGTLKITNSNPSAEGKIEQVTSSKNLFYVTGSTYQDVDPSVDGANYFTHLYIGENVVVSQSTSGYKAAVRIEEVYSGSDAGKAYGADKSSPEKPALTYATNIYAVPYITSTPSIAEGLATPNKGVAYGVRVDVYGTVEGQKYGIQTGGYLGSKKYFEDRIAKLSSTIVPTSIKPGNVTLASVVNPNNVALVLTKPFYAQVKDNRDASNGNYAVANIKNHVFGANDDENYSSFVYVHPTGVVKANEDLHSPASDGQPFGIYAGGYGRWKVEGYVTGCTGALIKSGIVDFENATVEGTGTEYNAANNSTSGSQATGSGIVISTEDSYVGESQVSIAGDSYVAANNGYALEEIITTQTGEGDSKVEAITIDGGTFAGGNIGTQQNPVEGTITITEKTATAENTVTIQGLSVTGTAGYITTASDGVSIGGQTLEQYFASQGSGIHITTVPDGDGTSTYVISAGPAPEPNPENLVSKNADESANVYFKWLTNTKDTIASGRHLKLAELEINTDGLEQELVVKNNAVLEVGRVVLCPDARIIVEAGGKFIVTGTQGIIAPSTENIVLKTSESAQATFLFRPEVSSNRHPNATVQLYSKAYRKANGQYVWQHFGVPTYLSGDNALKRGDIDYNHSTTPTAWRKIEHQAWVAFDANEGLKPFTCYGLTTTAEEAHGVYTFSCPLMGNDNVTLELTDEWNYYANSYMAPIDIKAMIANLAANYTNVSGTMYLYNSNNDWWYEINNSAYVFDATLPTTVKPMQAFVLQSLNDGENPVINYANQVYNPIVNPSLAPARSRASVNKAMIEIAAADGTTDCVRMIEDAQFSADFDNSYDAAKYMNTNSFNIFAGEQLGIIATDNLEGTTLSMTTKDQTSFTMTISHVEGMNYAVRDNLTGTEIEMVEGATYMFSVAANAKVEGRFEIVPVAKMPTAIENIETTAATKGIYTITGQFVGNDYHSLPNGIYVIDGKKIVK